MTKVNINKPEYTKNNTIHKIGNMYLEKTTEEVCILCSGTTNGMSMISLQGGFRFGESHPVADIYAITQEEFDIITDQINDTDDFVLVKTVNINVID